MELHYVVTTTVCAVSVKQVFASWQHDVVVVVVIVVVDTPLCSASMHRTPEASQLLSAVCPQGGDQAKQTVHWRWNT